jgi:hypothetical protein
MQLPLIKVNKHFNACQRKVLRRVKHWSADGIPAATGQHCANVVSWRSGIAMHSEDLHQWRLRNDAIVDAKQNFQYAALLSRMSARDKVLWRPPAKDIARRVHPTASFDFISEYFDRTAPDGVGIRVIQLSG